MVHTFSALGCYIAVDVNSGAVHVLDKLSYDLLTAADNCPDVMPELEGVPRQEAERAWQELMALKEQGLLFTPMDYVDPAEAVPKDAPVKALCLHVSHDCNLQMQVLLCFHWRFWHRAEDHAAGGGYSGPLTGWQRSPASATILK